MTKLSISNNLTLNQKGVLLISIVILILCLVWILPMNIGNIIKIIILTFLISTILFLALVFCHRVGFIQNNEGLYLTYFLFRFPIYRTKIGLMNFSDITILKSKKKIAHQKAARMEPDMSYYDYYFHVYLLNNSHTEKQKLISTRNEKKAERILEFLENNTNLKNNEYNPSF